MSNNIESIVDSGTLATIQLLKKTQESSSRGYSLAEFLLHPNIIGIFFGFNMGVASRMIGKKLGLSDEIITPRVKLYAAGIITTSLGALNHAWGYEYFNVGLPGLFTGLYGGYTFLDKTN